MRVYLKELKETPTDLRFDESEKWVREAVSHADEMPSPGNRPVALQFQISKVDEVAVLSGRVQTELRLLCSRCTTPVAFPLRESFKALFCQDPVLAGVAHLGGDKQDTPQGQIHGYARHHREIVGKPSADQDLDITYLADDFIDLSQVLTEQIQLQLPLQPLCKEDCQGICPHCGSDLNKGRCACSKIKKESPFSVLKNLKLDSKATSKTDPKAD